MGLGFAGREASKKECTAVCVIAAAAIVQIAASVMFTNIDFAAFTIFLLMCAAGCMALKTAKEIAVLSQENKQAVYETLKADIYDAARYASPGEFSGTARYNSFKASLKSTVL